MRLRNRDAPFGLQCYLVGDEEEIGGSTGWFYVPTLWIVNVTERRKNTRLRMGSLARDMDSSCKLRLEKAAPMNSSLLQDQYEIHGQKMINFHHNREGSRIGAGSH
ncbi:MAG: hypothetical protein OXE41_01430 [Gammaproteobacteria bacterium]|nr:hypothetical protein [Gammaproteobacteria bacterium]